MPRSSTSERGGGWQAGPAVCRPHRAALEAALWQKQVQPEAQRPDDLLLLGRRKRGESSTVGGTSGTSGSKSFGTHISENHNFFVNFI